MRETGWVLGPLGIDAEHRVTRPGCRTILVMVPTVTAGHRLMDLIPLLESDARLQVVFSVPHAAERWADPEDFVRGHHGLLVPWEQAIQHRFDLVLSASHRELDRVRGRVLLLPHGAGSRMSRMHSRKAGGATVPTTGLDRELLTYRGRVLPDVIALTHDDELAVLRERCPEAVGAAVVTGDICLDRMLACRGLRHRYRELLGVDEKRKLVTVSSTWTAESTFGRWPDLYQRLLAELPADRYRVAAVLHPNIWATHGRWQVRAWLADCLRAGLLLIPPEEGWQATVIASDWIIGDHGSTTVYAAALGRPVSLAAFPDGNIQPGSLADRLAGIAPRIDHKGPLLPQFGHATVVSRSLLAAVSSRPGRAAAALRSQMYRLLELSEPTRAAGLPPLPGPQPFRPTGGAG
ncbi:MAG TPA: hypothetical protein VFX16_35180 [Pseudonocardiaceae bacterium]|nr:hypothetical protein [Pseudonocardiaceae bacterium]